ncbi:hypothetical protein [Streptomyces davaonensis]|nr:hypothetical protein [Streptomyces davaonensis]
MSLSSFVDAVIASAVEQAGRDHWPFPARPDIKLKTGPPVS